jgi:hypothetical protein
MGAKTWMLVYADGDAAEALRGSPQLDRDETRTLVDALFPKEKLEPIGDGDLGYTSPPDHEIHAGVFPGISIVAPKEFGIDCPSELPLPFIRFAGSGTLYLHAMHSVVDWFAFAKWTGGKLVRYLSLSPDSGIMEDIGQKLPFEEPFWSGRHRFSDDRNYPFAFHPLDLGGAALKEFFGYQLEGPIDAALLEPGTISTRAASNSFLNCGLFIIIPIVAYAVNFAATSSAG